jgi:methylglyoxal synthase
VAEKKRVALVAHDNRKQDLAEWVSFNYRTIAEHKLYCTGTTGRIVRQTLDRRALEDGAPLTVDLTLLKSGPLGGDQQLGAMIAEGGIDALVFLWDPMEPQPHDVDVKALLRLAVLYNIPTACNRSTADFLISSPLFAAPYKPAVTDYQGYLGRTLQGPA